MLGVVPVFTPPNCTDVISPCDHHVGNWLKRTMAGFYHIELGLNRHVWYASGLSASRRRMFLFDWLLLAWPLFIQQHKLLVASFVHTGWLIALDGSENNLIKLQGWNRPYDFTKNDDEIGDISDDYECSSTEEDSIEYRS